jgi:hypothetical protein
MEKTESNKHGYKATGGTVNWHNHLGESIKAKHLSTWDPVLLLLRNVLNKYMYICLPKAMYRIFTFSPKLEKPTHLTTTTTNQI